MRGAAGVEKRAIPQTFVEGPRSSLSTAAEIMHVPSLAYQLSTELTDYGRLVNKPYPAIKPSSPE
jgi:hypothetical protein